MAIKLDKEQQNALRSMGYSITELPSLKPAPKITLYKRDEQGLIIEAPNLPADPFSIKRYLSRGFRYRPEDFEPQGFTCNTCGKQLKTKLALSGHMRSHKGG